MAYSCSLSCFMGTSKLFLFIKLSGAKSSIASATSIGISSSSVPSGVPLMGVGERGLAGVASGCSPCRAGSYASGAPAACSPCCTKSEFRDLSTSSISGCVLGIPLSNNWWYCTVVHIFTWGSSQSTASHSSGSHDTAFVICGPLFVFPGVGFLLTWASLLSFMLSCRFFFVCTFL